MTAAESHLIDTGELVDSLRRAIGYAASAGLLGDERVLRTLKDAEAALAAGARPDVEALSLALNRISTAISPITLVDLATGRDPLSPDNQRRSQRFRFWLTLFAFGVLLHIGYFIHSLQLEQAVLSGIDAIQEQQPRKKLVSLRKLAQFEKPLAEQSARNDLYHEKVAELINLNNRMMVTYRAATEAEAIHLFPLPVAIDWLASAGQTVAGFFRRLVGSADAGDDTRSATAASQPSSADGVDRAPVEPFDGTGSPKALLDQEPPAAPAVPDFCQSSGNNDFKLPAEVNTYPDWMRLIVADDLSDFCFQLKAFDNGSIANQSLTTLSALPAIREKVALRVDWFLPFFFGLLGSTLYVMRSVGNIRQPAVSLAQTIMRISLGGVAGIAIGWFSLVPPTGSIAPNGYISVSFVVAFVVGYGIDALFVILDRMNKLVSDLGGTNKAD